jgi:hypothetical protein
MLKLLLLMSCTVSASSLQAGDKCGRDSECFSECCNTNRLQTYENLEIGIVLTEGSVVDSNFWNVFS